MECRATDCSGNPFLGVPIPIGRKKKIAAKAGCRLVQILLIFAMLKAAGAQKQNDVHLFLIQFELYFIGYIMGCRGLEG